MFLPRRKRRARLLRAAAFAAPLIAAVLFTAHGARAQEKSPDEPEAATAEIEADAELRFVFQDAPWPGVLQQVADWAGLTLDLSDTPEGTFSYYDNRRHTPTEAIDVLNGYLLPRGYVLVRRDRFLAVLKTDNPALPNLIPTIDLEELAARGENELLRVTFPLDELDPDDAADEIGKLLGPHGSVAALENLQSVVVQGFGRNLRDVAAMLDQTVPPATDDKLEFRAFPLTHIPAAEAEKQVRQLFGLGSGTLNVSGARSDVERAMRYRNSRGRDRDDDDDDRRSSFSVAPLLAQAALNMQVSALPRSNSLLVTATPAGLALVERILTSIDAPPGEAQAAVAGESERELRVYTVQEASEEEVAKTLDVVMPGVVVNEDRRQDSIHILATPAEHEEVASLIRTLDGGGGGGRAIEVIPLTRFDPYAMSTLLSEMFDNEDRDERPIIQSEPHTRTLIVRGSQSQIEQIRATLRAYGEEGNSRAESRGARIRRVVVGAGKAAGVARAAEEILSEDRRFTNPIRVVVPGQTSDERESPGDDEATRPVRDESMRPEPDHKSARSDELPLARVAALDFAGQVSRCNSRTADVAVAVVRDEEEEVHAGDDEEPPAGDDEKPAARKDAPRGGRPPRVHIEVRGDELFLYSADDAALDEVEEMIRELVRQMPDRTSWTVFYLRAAEAAPTATLLYDLMPLPELTPGAPSPPAGALGTTAPTLRIIPDARTNALFVSGTDKEVEQIESFLERIDANELPPLLSDRLPRTIPVHYANVHDVADTIRELYRDYLTDPAARQRDDDRRDGDRDSDRRDDRDSRNRDSDNQNRSGGRGPAGRSLGVRLTLAVDEQSSELIVSCNEPLFRQISDLVRERDEAARESRPSVEMIRLPSAGPAQAAAVLQTLQALSPKVSVTQVPEPGTTAAPAPSRPAPASSPRLDRGSFDRDRSDCDRGDRSR